jgi:L-asparaginase II
MHAIPLVATTRGYPDTGNVVENVHMGSVAVVGAGGALQWFAGDPHAMVFTRSALKPFQALPFMLADGPARLGLAPADVALLCASHSGEAKHLAGVGAILERIGCKVDDLQCGCHAPLYYDSVGLPVPSGLPWTPLHHNCSGKHSGFLAWCRLHDVPTSGYLDRSHPLQQAISRTLGEALAVAPASMPVGMDGCSAPNYALPLARLAQLYARLSRGNSDTQFGSAMENLYHAMSAHPDLVSGQARCDLAYMTAGAGDWVSKVGADALQAIGIRSAGMGIVVKIADGAPRALHSAVYSVLDQLGLLNDERRRQLAHYRQPPLKNARGSTVGDIRALFTLQRAA